MSRCLIFLAFVYPFIIELIYKIFSNLRICLVYPRSYLKDKIINKLNICNYAFKSVVQFGLNEGTFNVKIQKISVYQCQPWQNKWKKRKHISVWDAMIVAPFRYPYCRHTFSIVNIDNNLINMGQIPLLLQNYIPLMNEQHDYSQISRWMINNNEIQSTHI